MTEEVNIVNEENSNKQALILKQQVGELVVCDKESFDRMTSIEQTAKDNIKALKAHMDGAIKEAHAKHKKLTTLLKRITDPFKAVAEEARDKRSEWARKERERAENARREQEAILAKAAEEERLKQAQALEASGNKEMAEAILDAPIPPPVALPEVDTPKIKGEKEIWYAVIVDVKAMFEAYGSAKAPIPELDDKKKDQLCTILGLNSLAKGLKLNLSAVVAGVEGRKKYSK